MSLLTGTRIATPRGLVPVEALQPGDTVLLSTGNESAVRWVGVRTLFRDMLPTGWMANYLPIRIEPDALGDGIPAAPLMVSPDQILRPVPGADFAVPARDLANNMTVCEQRAEDRYRFRAVMLTGPGDLMAEGVPVESFIGRRSPNRFFNVAEFPRGDAPALPDVTPPPLDADRWQALRQQLRRRAQAMGWTRTADPDLHFAVEGTLLPGQRTGDSTWRVELPESGKRVAVASRGWMPAADSPTLTGDTRLLGVPVSHVTLIRGDVSLVIRPGALTGLRGFHNSERSHIWTNGFAWLPQSLLATLEGFHAVELELFHTRLQYAMRTGAAAEG